MQIYYVEPTLEQKQAYELLKKQGEVSFPFRSINQKVETLTNTTFDKDISCPSQVICMAMVCFVNKGTILAQSSSKELDLTAGSGQYNHAGQIRPMFNIKQIYCLAGTQQFPHSTGLNNPTAAQLKKYCENVYGKADKYSL